MQKIILGTSTQGIILKIVGFQNRLLALLSQPCFYEEKSQRNFKRLRKLIGFFTHFSTWIFFRAIRKMKFLKVNSKFFYTHYIQQQLSIGTGSMAPNKRQMTLGVFPFTACCPSLLLYTVNNSLTLFGMGGDTFIPLSFWDQILSADFFSKISKPFWR